MDEKDPARALDAYLIQTKQYEAYNTWLTDMRNVAQVVRAWTFEKVPPTPSPCERLVQRTPSLDAPHTDDTKGRRSNPCGLLLWLPMVGRKPHRSAELTSKPFG